MHLNPVRVNGWGIAVPRRRVTNADLAARLDTSHEWILERTGIAERRVAGPDETTATLAGEAAASAMKQAGLTPDDVGLLVVATATGEQPMPATSAFVADALGLSCGAFDVDAACAGFVYGLVVGASLLSTGGLSSALVVGSDTMSRVVDQDDRSTAVLFGDGAGAVVVTPASAGGGILAWDLGCDGSATALIEIRAGGSRQPVSAAVLEAGDHWLRMQGQEVFRRAVRVVVDSATATLDRAGVSVEDVDLFIPHQANARMIDAIASRLGIAPGRTLVNVDRYGNTSAASVPLVLAEAAEAGTIADGDLVLLSGFGAGMTWATALLRWES